MTPVPRFALDLGADDDELAATTESPTIDSLGSEAPTVEADMGGATMESPTLESPMVAGDAEPPELDIDLEATDAGSTMESPTLQLPDSNSETSEMPALDASPDDAAALDDPTAFDVDLSGLADFAEDGGESIDSGESIG